MYMNSGYLDRYSVGIRLTPPEDELGRQLAVATKTVHAAECHMLSSCSFPRVLGYIYIYINNIDGHIYTYTI